MLYLVKYWENTYSPLLISYLALGVQLFLKWMDHLDPGQRSLARRIQFGWEVLGPRERIVQEKDLLIPIQDLHHLLTMRDLQGKFFFDIRPLGPVWSTIRAHYSMKLPLLDVLLISFYLSLGLQRTLIRFNKTRFRNKSCCQQENELTIQAAIYLYNK